MSVCAKYEIIVRGPATVRTGVSALLYLPEFSDEDLSIDSSVYFPGVWRGDNKRNKLRGSVLSAVVGIDGDILRPGVDYTVSWPVNGEGTIDGSACVVLRLHVVDVVANYRIIVTSGTVVGESPIKYVSVRPRKAVKRYAVRKLSKYRLTRGADMVIPENMLATCGKDEFSFNVTVTGKYANGPGGSELTMVIPRVVPDFGTTLMEKERILPLDDSRCVFEGDDALFAFGRPFDNVKVPQYPCAGLKSKDVDTFDGNTEQLRVMLALVELNYEGPHGRDDIDRHVHSCSQD